MALADYNEEAPRKAAEAQSSLRWRNCDVTDREQVAQLYQWLGEEIGSIDILVNSVGINVANRIMANINYMVNNLQRMRPLFYLKNYSKWSVLQCLYMLYCHMLLLSIKTWTSKQFFLDK